MIRKLFSSPMIALGMSVIINSILIGYLITSPVFHSNEPIKEGTQFNFLSPRIFVEEQNDLLINFTNLRTQLQTYTKPLKDRIGLYFEYLPSGTSIGINEKESFIFASLLKTPMIMAIYQQIDLGKLKPDQLLTVEEIDLDPRYGTLWKKGAGTTYTVQELINLTLIESDNTASNVLFNQLPAGGVDAIFDQLDIPKDLEKNAPVVTPKNYSSILRSLYLSSILTKNHSNEILKILSKAPLNYSTHQIPLSLPIAHKIGVYQLNDSNFTIFSDCGIFYPPKRPYILCVMTQTNEDRANTIFPALSDMVYSYVTNTNAQ